MSSTSPEGKLDECINHELTFNTQKSMKIIKGKIHHPDIATKTEPVMLQPSLNVTVVTSEVIIQIVLSTT